MDGIKEFETQIADEFEKATGVRPYVEARPYLMYDIGWDYSDMAKPKLVAYSAIRRSPRVLEFWVYFAEAVKKFQERQKSQKV